MRSLEDSLQLFRQASRELFNHCFRPSDASFDEGWVWQERFEAVESALFRELVADPHELAIADYGATQSRVAVSLRQGNFAPIMINRDVDSGCWDFPLKEFTQEAQLQFVRFFDWDLLAVRNNQYVRVVIAKWPSHPEAVGKHALVEAQHVKYSEA